VDPGIWYETQYIVQYTRPNKAEGGPIETRHFDNYMAAMKHADNMRSDSEVKQVQVWRQETKMERVRLH